MWNNKDILFLSGCLFLTSLDHLWTNDILKSNFLEDYIKLRYFNYKPNNIKIYRELSTVLFYSEIKKKDIILRFKITLVENGYVFYKIELEESK